MQKQIIIISTSLTNDFMSPKEKFLKVQVHVGLQEIHRLMGEGEDYSRGPLPTYLNQAIRAKKDGLKIHHILIRDLHDPNDPLQQPELLRFGNHNLIGTEGAEFVNPILFAVDHSEVIDTHVLTMPVYDFHRLMNQIFDKDLLTLTSEERGSVHFIITGVYTNIMVFNLAARIRCDYEFPHVFVSPHLVGSKHHQAHLSTLQVDLPNSLVSVVPSLKHIYEVTGIRREMLDLRQYDSCRIKPDTVKNAVDDDTKRIIENIFMFSSEVRLKPLSGGYSGGLLFLAEGRKKGAITDPEILKIDSHEKMHQELQGYNLVKAFLGKIVPTFSPAVFRGNYTGIKMELAAMAGEPETLQSRFEKVTDDEGLSRFLLPFESALNLLQDKLYKNTKSSIKIYPYKAFALHTDQQQIWLKENISHILADVDLQSEMFQLSDTAGVKNCLAVFNTITKHIDRLSAETSLCHGDLNFANIICDTRGNAWVIDWAYAGEMPVEIDFAKMENDIKFVMTKEITNADLPGLLALETFLLSSIHLPEIEKIPKSLDKVKKDIRLKKIYLSLRMLREKYLSLKTQRNQAFYKIALLKYAVHSLSFDKKRGRGECSPAQLKYALLSTCLLVESLAGEDLHEEIKKETPDSYPERLPVSKNAASWNITAPQYNPVYYVDPEVLRNDYTKDPDGWADPEDWVLAEGLKDRKNSTGKIRFDRQGKPLNPGGRTGIQGRGLLGKWGPNYAVDPAITRLNPITEELEVILIKREDTGEWGLPGTIMVKDETFIESAKRALTQKTKNQFDFSHAKILGQMVIDDYRNTDNAWMESCAIHLHVKAGQFDEIRLEEGLGVMDAAWVPITPEVVNRLYANHSDILKSVLVELLDSKDPGIDKASIRNTILNI